MVAVALAGVLSACTGSSDSGADAGTAPGGGKASPTLAAPGKYRTLPEPCGAVSTDTLKAMLPGAEADAAEDGGEGADVGSGDSDGDGATRSPYEGEASVTYDTDRRVGCAWESATGRGSHQLRVDFERVVSYDPEISDDAQTELLYGQRAEKVGVDADAEATADAPAESKGTSGSSSTGAQGSGGDEDDTDGGSSTGSGTEPESVSGGAGADTGDEAGDQDGGQDGDGADGTTDGPGGEPTTSAPSAEEPVLPSRNLDGIGDAAYIDDQLVDTRSGRAAHRDVTLVFRTENVLVTVEYTQSVTGGRSAPDSAKLQERAQALAKQLSRKINDN